MADRKDFNTADDLLNLLNNVHNENSEAEASLKEPENADVSTHVDELLDILSRPAPKEEPEEEIAPEIPVSLFDHLSEEGQGSTEAITDEANSINSHFTDDSTPETEPEAPEESDENTEEEEEEQEKVSIFRRIGSAVIGTSFLPKALIYIALIIISVAYLSYYIITIGNDVFALVTNSREVTIVIEEGHDSHEEVGKLLQDNGIIEYAWVYELYMEYRGDGDSDDTYILGEHVLNTDQNYSQLITALTTGNIERTEISVTIPEGSTVEDIITILVDAGIGNRADYIDVINNYPYKWDFVKQLDEMGYSEDRLYRLEGYLYPDTYFFYNDEEEVYVINKMLNAFYDKFWKDFVKVDKDGESPQIWAMDEYGMTFDDIIVFASMLQSEGGTAEDFYYISYVFHNRLDHSDDFPYLQSDATTQYVLPERVDSSSAELVNYDSPYNTYKNEGLPPGAISNPGADALNAALFPERPQNERGGYIDAFYFVANNAGKTYYAETDSGHEANKEQVAKDNAAIESEEYVD